MAQEFKLSGLTSLSALKPGDKAEVEVDGLDGAKLLVVNTAGTVHAIGPKCTHYGAPLKNGVLTVSGRLRCPWHGACFNTTTGDVEDAPALDALPVFSVREKAGAVYVSGDPDTIKAGRRKPSFACSTATAAAGAPRIVVVGGGSGAMGVVEGLRERGFAGPITLITNEGYLPIDRTKLSKALIADPAKVQWRDAAWFGSGAVDIVHDEVTAVEASSNTVTTRSGATHRYNKLVLATGGTPRRLPLPGFKDLGNIFTLRRVSDVKQITGAIGADKGRNIVVIGSSFIGMEVAAATADGNSVTVVGMEKVPLERVLGERVGSIVRKGLEAKGVKFYMSAGVDRAEPSATDPSKVGAVVLKDDTRLEVDLVILGVGVAPATSYLQDNEALKLEKDGSLKTDETFAVVGVSDVYAIGDIATYPYHGPGGLGKPVRIEHWNVAQNAGRAVAHAIADSSHKPKFFVPIFWSALGSQLRYCGHPVGGFDDVVLRGTPDEGKFAAYYAKGDTVVAVATMGMDPVMTQCAELMLHGTMPGKAQLEGGLDVMSVGPLA